MESVISILRIEESTSQTLQNLNSVGNATAEMHYVKYDKKRKSSGKNYNSTSDKKCYRCGNPFVKDHLKNCPARDIECKFCGIKRHFAKCCGKNGKFPKEKYTAMQKENSAKRDMHTLQTVEELDFYDEVGNLRVYPKDGVVDT